MRDYQRSKVYRAEEVLKGHGRRFETVPEIQEYVDKLVGSAWFRRRWPDVARSGIRVLDGRGRQSAAGSPTRRLIKMPRWSRTEPIVLHEIAHVVAPKWAAWHGREFCRALLELVGRQLGRNSRSILQYSFVACRVRHRGSDKDWLARAQRLREKRVQRDA